MLPLPMWRPRWHIPLNRTQLTVGYLGYYIISVPPEAWDQRLSLPLFPIHLYIPLFSTPISSYMVSDTYKKCRKKMDRIGRECVMEKSVGNWEEKRWESEIFLVSATADRCCLTLTAVGAVGPGCGKLCASRPDIRSSIYWYMIKGTSGDLSF